MKLYEAPSLNARRAHFLWPKRSRADRVAVDIRAAENLSADYLAKTPVVGALRELMTARVLASPSRFADIWSPFNRSPRCLGRRVLRHSRDVATPGRVGFFARSCRGVSQHFTGFLMIVRNAKGRTGSGLCRASTCVAYDV